MTTETIEKETARGARMLLRDSNIERLKHKQFDVLILGGGINGAVSAAALAARGVNVAVIDKQDFASFCSSNSSNLAWGGIKYLENSEFGLVNKLCKSRNLLMRSYPSTVKEIRFLTCVQKGFRFPPFFIFMGTLVYWLFGRFFTEKPHYYSARAIKKREPKINTDDAAGGFEYSDAYLFDNDARFVFSFIRSSLDYGAVAANYVTAKQSRFEDNSWHTEVTDNINGDTFTVKSTCLINACGPFVDELNSRFRLKTQHRHVFSKGIHIIVDRITEVTRVLAFFASDGRLFFVIPMGRKTCIGTTDTQVESPLTQVTEEDRQFVLNNANELLDLETPLTINDIISERCGVRPLAVKGADSNADWVQLSRKHAMDVNKRKKHISIFGGKLTDCLNVGDEVCAIVAECGIKMADTEEHWYGEDGDEIKSEFFHQATAMGLDSMTWSEAAEPLSQRFWRRYGRRALDLLEKIRQDPSQAKLLIHNAEFTRSEIEHTAKYEMVTKLDDFLRRRSKISLVVRREELIQDKGLLDACKILFGDEAEKKLNEYAGNPKNQ